MAKNALRLALLILVIGSLLSSANARNPDKHKEARKKDDGQIVVIVRQGRKDLEFHIGSERYDRGQAAYALGELRLTRRENTPVVVLIDARVDVAAISAVPAMAIDAGFDNVHTYVFWPWTKRMAEIQFGPVLKFSENPPSE
jgi:biopolymer transport protein ExbD